jgi:hypothetical protein
VTDLMADRFDVLRELWRITEWRDGCVFRTEFVRRVWVPFGTPATWLDEHLLVAVSSDYEGPTIRPVRPM